MSARGVDERMIYVHYDDDGDDDDDHVVGNGTRQTVARHLALLGTKQLIVSLASFIYRC